MGCRNVIWVWRVGKGEQGRADPGQEGVPGRVYQRSKPGGGGGRVGHTEWCIPSGADRDVRRIVWNQEGQVGRSVLRGACRKGIKSVSLSFIVTGSTGPAASKMGAVERVGKGKMGRGARGPPRES